MPVHMQMNPYIAFKICVVETLGRYLKMKKTMLRNHTSNILASNIQKAKVGGKNKENYLPGARK